MRKSILLVVALLLTIFPFVEAKDNGNIEHVGGNTIITYEGKSITISNDVINTSTQQCPTGYHLGSAEEWSDVIKMWRDIKGNQCEYMSLSETNSLYKINEQYEQGKDYNACLYYFKEDLQVNNTVTPREYGYYKTSSYGKQHKSYIFVYDGLNSTTISPIEHIQGYIGSVSIKTCDLTNDLPGKNPNGCRDIVNGRCFKDNENDSDKNDNDSDKNDNDSDKNDNVNNNSIINNGYSEELNDAYAFAYENGITTMKTIEETNMNGGLDRIAMAKMLSKYAINILGKELDTTKQCNFNDVSAQMDSSYDNGVTLACQLGIMGVGMTNFRPNDIVTRAEFGTALSRMLYNLSDGTDNYFSTHLAKLKEEGIISNDDPTLKELRGYVMLMLMRSAK